MPLGEDEREVEELDGGDVGADLLHKITKILKSLEITDQLNLRGVLKTSGSLRAVL